MKAKKIYFSIFASMLMLFAMSVNVFAVDEVAKIGDTPYETLENAISNVQSGETIKLIANVELTEGITINGGKTFTLDLNGNNISAPDTTLTIQNANVTITGSGKIEETSPNYGAIILKGSNENVANYTKVVVGKDVTLIGWSPLFIREYEKNVDDHAYGIVADVYGTLNGVNDVSGATGNGIYINGRISATENCPIINIYPSAKISGTDIGISALGQAIWNIYGGKISGLTAIYQKSGRLTIGGNAKIEAFGDKTDYKNNGNGCDPTGEAIIVESCGYPGGAPEVSITGGYFYSQNNKAIGSYVKDNTYTKITGFVSGGYFTSDPTEFLAEGKIAVKSDDKEYLYMVVDKNSDITVETKAEGFKTFVSGDSSIEGIENVNVEFQGEDYMKSIAATLANDPAIINSEEALEAAKEIPGYVSGESKVVVTIKPYMEVKIVGYESGENGKALTLDITPKYDIVVSLSGDTSNSVTLVSGEKMLITDRVQIRIVLPEGFAPAYTIYVNHKGYIYNVAVIGDNSISFGNPDGFSQFVVKTTDDTVATRTNSSESMIQPITTAYDTLAGAIKEVNDNDNIVLKKDTKEVVTVNKVVTFTFEPRNCNFSGEIKAGPNVQLVVTDGNTAGVKVYTFTEKEEVPSEEKPVGGGGSTIVKYTVKFETNCDSKIENVRVERNEKVKEPKAPVKEGYSFAGWYTDKDCTKAYDFDSKVTSSFTLYAKWEEVVEQWKNTFKDVNENQWFYEAVEFANRKSLFNGMSATEFGPDVSMTRAMLVTVLYRWAGEPEVSGVSKFADVVKGSYYEKALIWAEKNGIVTGITETEFKPDMEITREQIVAIMFRFANYMKFDVSVGEDTNILSYEDFNEISEYAIPAMQWAVGANLVKGNTVSTLDPRSNTTRAQVATILQRFIENN